jgi:putative nucleotidyltransferase-like protein
LEKSAEFSLLLTCLRWPLEDQDRQRIRDIFRHRIDPAAFSELIRRHQVAPLVYRNLIDARCDEFPVELRSQLRESARRAVTYSVRRLVETARLVGELQRSAIEVRVLKGVTLSFQAYQDATLQRSLDIDLLVPVEQLFDAEQVLIRCGYHRAMPSGHLTPRRTAWLLNHAHQLYLVHSRTREAVELHWCLTSNPFRYEKFKPERTSASSLRIGQFEIPSLGTEDMLLHACMHGSDHCWYRLKWLAPVAAIMRAMSRDELGAVSARGEQLEVIDELNASLSLAEHYGLIDSSTVAIPLELSARSRRIVRSSIRAVEAPAFSNNAIVDFWQAWQARSSFKYRRNLIESTIIRNESWELIDLPDRLFLGYVLIAPLAFVAHRLQNRRNAKRALASYAHGSMPQESASS